MKNHNVEKLMPDIYAKYHYQALEAALQKGPEGIPNKERLVFARHKSGYIFPVWLQIKAVQSYQQGIQFVAMFKLDKKIISSNIAYLLVSKERRILNISSSCIKMLSLDIQKLKRLNHNNIDINKIAPELFSSEQQEF